MDLSDLFPCYLHHIAFDRLKSHTPFPCLASQLIYIFLKFQCVLCILNVSVHSHPQRVLFQNQCLLRYHYCTMKTTSDKGQCPIGHQTKPGPSPILLRLQQLAVVCSTEKNLSISVSSHLCCSQTVCSL